MSLNRMHKGLKSAICLMLVITLLYSFTVVSAVAAETTDTVSNHVASQNTETDVSASYNEYINSYADAEYPYLSDTKTVFRSSSKHVEAVDRNGTLAYYVLENGTDINFSVDTSLEKI